MTIKINEHLTDLPFADYRTLEDLQKGLKTLEHVEYNKLRSSLQDRGLLAPFFVWVEPGTSRKKIMDGHQRKRVFVMESVEPFEVPYIIIPGATEQEAKENLLTITSQYGKISERGLEDFVFEAQIPLEWIQATVNFDALNKVLEQSVAEQTALKAFPQDIELKGFIKTHVLLTFPPEKLIEIQDLLKPILEKEYVEYEQSSN